MRANHFGLIAMCALAPTLSRANTGIEIEEYRGTQSYVYRFDLPRARGRYQPALAIRYGFPSTLGMLWPADDTQKNHGYGTGWYLNVPQIEKPGVGGSNFQFVSGNERTLLVPSARETGYNYAAKVDNAHFSFGLFNTSILSARDALGNVYTFTDRGRNTSTDSKWLLQRVVDPDGNVTRYLYGVDLGLTPEDTLHTIYYNAYNPAAPDSTEQPGDTGYYETRVELHYSPVNGVDTLGSVHVYVADGTALWKRYSITQEPVGYGESNVRAIFDSTVSAAGEFVTTFGYSGRSRLGSVVTPLGARYDLTLCSASDFGVPTTQTYSVVGSLTVSGPGVPSRTTHYWYSTPVFDGDGGYRGFGQTWTQDDGSAIATHTWWETGSLPFVGWPVRSEAGTLASPGLACHGGSASSAGTPPSLEVFSRRSSWHQAHD